MRLLFFVLLIGLSGCCSWRKACIIDPPVAALDEATQIAAMDPLFEDTDCIPRNWWELFNDEQLTTFIDLAFARNPTFAIARANVLLAEANADRVRSSLFPYTWLGADVSRQKLSKTGVVPFPGTGTSFPTGPNIPEYFTLYETQLNLKYDFDFWGKHRNAFRSALNQVQAELADAVFSRLCLAVSVAKVYFRLQADYRRREVLHALVENRQKYSDLISQRIENGIDTQLIYYTAQTNLGTATRLLYQVEAAIAAGEAQLKTYLAGDFQEAICDINILQKPLPKVPLPSDLPLSLLARRPDITAQIWLIESAGKEIAVAKAGFYPDFNLTAFFGFQTIHFAKLFRWDSSYFNIDPAVTLPLFDGGRLVANYHEKEVDYDKAILRYNELVLNAAQEVITTIAAVHYTHQEWLALEKNYQSEKNNFDLTLLRLQNNISSNLDFLIREESMLVALDQELIALGSTYQTILSLIKALGGGYNPCLSCD